MFAGWTGVGRTVSCDGWPTACTVAVLATPDVPGRDPAEACMGTAGAGTVLKQLHEVYSYRSHIYINIFYIHLFFQK